MNSEKLSQYTLFQLAVVEQFCDLFKNMENGIPDRPHIYFGDKLRSAPLEFISAIDFERMVTNDGDNDSEWHVVFTHIGVCLVTRHVHDCQIELLPVADWPEAFTKTRENNRWRWMTDDGALDFVRQQILAAMSVNTYNYNVKEQFPTDLVRHTNIKMNYTVLADETGDEFAEILDWLLRNPAEDFWHGIMQFRICGIYSPVGVLRINNVVVVNSVPADHRQWAITWAKFQGIYNDDTDELFIRRCFQVVQSTNS